MALECVYCKGKHNGWECKQAITTVEPELSSIISPVETNQSKSNMSNVNPVRQEEQSNAEMLESNTGNVRQSVGNMSNKKALESNVRQGKFDKREYQKLYMREYRKRKRPKLIMELPEGYVRVRSPLAD